MPSILLSVSEIKSYLNKSNFISFLINDNLLSLMCEYID